MTGAARVEVVVPVYNAVDDLRRCVESVLACTRGDYALVLIDDASPDPRVRAYFDELAARRLPQLTLLRNDANLGFTGTANRGMARSRADVVLLNSDTIVTEGWLDALARCVASDPAIGTATPFSNNAEICSYPRFCEDNPWPEGTDPEPVRASIAAAAVPLYPDIPTGVGFCMYVRRALLDAIGAFDAAFGAGYGEENDFCMRAAAAGFRNVLCDDAFVVHVGGRSFEGAKETLGVRNTALLLERHPGYLDLVRDYIEQDPLGALRDAARTAHDRRHGPPLAVLHVIHGGGGTEAQARVLIEATRGTLRHALAIVKGDTWRVEEHRSDGSTKLCEFARRADEPLEDFLRMLCATYGAEVIHLHNISGNREALQEAMPRLGVPYGYTLHDLSFACPTITLTRADGYFCGGVTDAAACAACLAEQRHPDADIARWRERHAALLAGAAFVIAPSGFAADLLRRYFPAVAPMVVAHGLPPREPRRTGARQVVLRPDDGLATVAVLGAVGPDKGSRRVERLAERAGRTGAGVRFVVVGYTDRHHRAWQDDDARLTVHGRYDPRDLPWLLDHYRARLVLFPSLGPETFAFTLSEAWLAGRAVLVPPIGALAERVRQAQAGWLMSDAEWRDDARLLERIEALLAPAHADALAGATRCAAALALPSVEAMAAATTELYVNARAAQPVTHPPVDCLRVVEAYGYRRWTAAKVQDRSAARAHVEVGAEAGAAGSGDIVKRLRATAAGRVLYRLLPEGVRAALRARAG